MVYKHTIRMNHVHIITPIGTLCIEGDNKFVSAINFDCKCEEIFTTDVLEQCKTQLEEYFHKKRTVFTIPLLPYGTKFQQDVWMHLLKIPYGKTSSYLDIAKELGNEKKLRAVGNANSKNPIPILIPCHRVIGSKGALTGYAGGLDKKEWLLKHEGAINQLRLFHA